MTRATNIKFLKTLQTRAPRDNRNRIQEVIDRYESRQINNYKTAQNAALALMMPSMHKPQHAERLINKAVQHVIPQRLKRKLQIDFTLKVLLFTSTEKKDPRTNAIVELSEDEQKKYKRYMTKKYTGLRLFWVGRLEVSQGSNEFFAGIKDKMIKRSDKKDKNDWKALYEICDTDPNFHNRERNAPGYLEGIMVLSADMKPKEGGVDPVTTRKRVGDDGESAMMNHRYVTNRLDLSRDTFKEAMTRENYIKNECWINAIYEFYGDNLLRANKTQNKVTRGDVIKILGRTEESIKRGLTCDEVTPFFEQFKLKLRVFDVFHKLIFRYDPRIENFHHKPMYVMVDGSHVYTLNYDINRLEQMIINKEEEVFLVKASTNYLLREDKNIVNYKMISHINDIITILRDAPAPPVQPKRRKKGEAKPEVKKEKELKEIVFLIQKDNDLEAILWQLIDAKYIPKVRWGAGTLATLTIEANGTIFILRNQNLTNEEIDGLIEVDTEECYKKVNDAMFDFQMSVFKNEHLSHYSKQDVDILDEYRTVANVGCSRSLQADLVEIDIGKAYTAALKKISCVPVFNEFDRFKPYKEGDAIQDMNLYTVKAKGNHNLFFNKRNNLCYGFFLKKFLLEGDKTTSNLKILEVKQPSFVRPANYAKLVDELWSKKLSENPEEDAILKKTIANTNIGSLEKSVNKKQFSQIYTTYEDAKYYQTRYGGEITVMRQQREVKTYQAVNLLDQGIEDAEMEWSIDFQDTGKKIYILTISATASLTNGFRYIKELLMQHHNFYLKECYDKLQQAGVEVFSVKTDALTIKAIDFEKAKKAIVFNGSIGNWRISKTDDIKFPQGMLEMRQNRIVEVEELKFNDIPLTIEEEYDTDKLCHIFALRMF